VDREKGGDVTKRPQTEVRVMELAALSPAPYNPRTISEEAARGLQASIRRFGLVQPIVWNRRTKHVVGGHQRINALKSLGKTEAQVVVVDVPETEEKALNLTLNNPAITGEFTDGLQEILAELAVSPGIEFEELRLDALLDLKADAVVEDEVPEPPKNPVTRSGDLWILGDHRLLCGDSTRPEDVGRVMNGRKADLFQTDPPYLVDYTGADRPNESGKDWSAQYREIDIRDAGAFFASVFACAASVTKANAAWYCWHAHKRASEIETAWARLGILNHQQIVWVKPVALHGYSFWPYQHEPCLMGWKKGHKPAHDGDNSHTISTVWMVDWQGKSRVVGNEHPTQKPVELFARPYRKHTRPGSVGFEPFSGSGSQLIAAEQLGRRCYAIELEPAFVDVAIERWKNLTGEKARRA
jgi:DNA modification methylase